MTNSNERVRDAATLGLGILGDEAALEPLNALLADSSAGRQRVLAAEALGILGTKTRSATARRTILAELVATLKATRTAEPDLGVACLLALGLLPLEDAGATRQLGELLLEVFQDETRGATARCHAATAAGRQLARLGEADDGTIDESIESVLEVFLDELERKADPTPAQLALSRNSVIALGQLSRPGARKIDKRVRMRLFKLRETRRGPGAEHFALIALAKIAGRARSANPKESQRAADEIAKHLESNLLQPDSEQRAWAALASGLMIGALEDRAPKKLIETPEDSLKAASAAKVLGKLAHPRRTPWRTAFTTDLNYFALPPLLSGWDGLQSVPASTGP